ncbi:MAG: ABC transporter permease [Cytophagales bacterium]|nr:ABC transporter permease [Cytophagales bacterium]MCA6367738.1 ABC transporter permease [Cytophagales bacterium]MCA6369978.1 ABC transporter permease [Cytophagales bacterium]MCA6375137.1 ABC transporter permease [Cytophagales bacterium]MCA6382553.1 ABC transporter permease [Cytophagales bacterium]
MIKNYLLITFRNLMKNKLFIFINVFGMGLAIACCITAYLNWGYSSNWDKTHDKAQSVYRVQFWREFQGKKNRFGMAPMPLGSFIKQNIKEVDKTVRYMSSYCDMRIGEEVFGDQMAYADSAFFDLFTFQLKYGSYSNFYDKGKVFISDKIAKNYFNKEDVVGQSMTQIVLGADGVRRPKEFEIGGVFKKPPQNNSFGFDVITLFDNFWDVNLDKELSESNWKRWAHVLFLKIEDPAKVAIVTKQLQQYIEPQNKVREDFKISEYYLENFVGLMQRNRANPRLDSDYLGGGIPDEAITAPAIMAVLLLLLACFNFTNTSIAISGKRLKEIGIRKVMGSLRKQLIMQFLGENLILCFLGLLAGLLMAEWLVPAYDNMWTWLDLNLSYTENVGFLLFLILLLVATALIAGSYPAFYITSFEPVSILKGKAKFGGTNWFTRILLGGQFVISLLAIIMGVAFYQNGEYQKNYDLGFVTHGVISAWVNNENSFNTYRDALSSNKDIQLIAGTRHHVANSRYNDPVKYESIEREVDIMDIGDNYLEVMDMTLLSGRKFQKDSETDRKESILVTEEFVKQYGWKDSAVGKRVVWMDTVQLYVIGVVKNVYTQALWGPIQPLMLRYANKDKYQQLLVKVEPTKIASVNDYMEKKWKEVFPNTLYTGQWIDQELQETNEINKNVSVMFGFLGFFAALMTGIGLYTLVSLNIEKKMKEIGVRKVLGASVANISGVINFEFVVNLGVATVIGGAAGYFAADALMDSIWEYYMKLNVLTLLLSVTVMVIIAVAAVGYKTISTAMLNPTKTLRVE